MKLATWNLNHRTKEENFRPAAAQAAAALGADLVVFTEYFPYQGGRFSRDRHEQFCEALAASGLVHSLLSNEPIYEPNDPNKRAKWANRTLIVSRLELERDELPLPYLGHQYAANQFRSNALAAKLPTLGLRILGLRVPAYKGKWPDLHRQAWEWIESAAARLRDTPAVILGDLNESNWLRDCFGHILESGWKRAAPAGGSSFYGHTGKRSEIDHILVTPHCTIRHAEYVTSVPGFTLSGPEGDGLSDHAALVADIDT